MTNASQSDEIEAGDDDEDIDDDDYDDVDDEAITHSLWLRQPSKELWHLV